jgi:GTP pyrophosphokinase/guanosine-3',5'-bis(diphosphate) 3'-pyrophosphohydrolase
MVTTGRAKSAIRRALREVERSERARFGRQLLERAFTRAGYDMGEDDLGRATSVLELPNDEALFAAVAASELHPDDVFKAANPDRDRDASAEIAAREEPAVFLRGAQRSPMHHFCPVCMPIPFERIIGVVERGKDGVAVHRIDCNRLDEDDSDEAAQEWLDMFWGEGADAVARYRTRAALTLANEPGALGSVCTGVGALGANIENLRIVERKPSYYNVVLDLEVRDARHLHKILRALDAQQRVDKVERISGVDAATT